MAARTAGQNMPAIVEARQYTANIKQSPGGGKKDGILEKGYRQAEVTSLPSLWGLDRGETQPMTWVVGEGEMDNHA
jgi:hypothetical protein